MPDRPPFPIPENLTPDTYCLCIQIPNDPIWKTVMSGLLWMPGEWFNWQRDEARSGRELAHYWRELYAQIDWSNMSCCCNNTVLATQFNPDGSMSVTLDGTTYIPAQDVGADPRYTSPQLPNLPDTGIEADNKCRAATNLVEAMQDAVNAFGSELGTFENIIALAAAICLAIVGVFTVPPSAAVLIPIVIALAQAIFSVATGTYLALFTDAVYDDLQCIFYNNIGPDGTFSQDNFLDIITECDGHGFDSNVALTFTSVIRGWQVPGMNAAVRGGALNTGDCSDCETHCFDDIGFETGGFSTIASIDEENCIITLDSVPNPNPSGGPYVCGFDFGAGCGSFKANSSTETGGWLDGWFPCGGSGESTGFNLPGTFTSVQYAYAQSDTPFQLVIQVEP